MKKPPLGAWKLGHPGTGFTLKNGSGAQRNKAFVTNLHALTPPDPAPQPGSCSAKPATVRVLGRYAIKTFSRGGYTTWGVGRNTGGDVTPMPARISAGGKTYNGTFYLVWDYSNFSACSAARSNTGTASPRSPAATSSSGRDLPGGERNR